MRHVTLSPVIQSNKKKIRNTLLFFIAGLSLSGITAFPLQWEMQILNEWVAKLGTDSNVTRWIDRVTTGVTETAEKYPFMAYGTDWLAFAHLVIAVAFVGPLRDPVRNKWVIEFGVIACFAVFPLALIAGAVRGIPFFWQLIDCSFGVAGGCVLFVCLKWVNEVELLETSAPN